MSSKHLNKIIFQMFHLQKISYLKSLVIIIIKVFYGSNRSY